MQSLRSSIRRLPIHKITKAPLHINSSKMSLFPRFSSEVSPFFRLVDDYDRFARSALSESGSSAFRTFSPKFDVKEVKDAYELHGELPGIEQKNINIEWTDGNTLTISGRAEHRSERGTRPSATSTAGAIEGGEKTTTIPSEQHEYHKPTVEDEQKRGAESSSDNATTDTATEDKATAVTKATDNKDVAKPASEPFKYWVTERSVGEFHRSFSFPDRVDHEAVKASLKNGILSIIVPKAKRPDSRKIQVNIE